MNKLKRIISLAFIIAFALSQFEYVKAESVEADMTNAQNAETVVVSEEVEKEEAKEETVLAGAQDVQDPQVAGCKTHKEAVEELTKAMDERMDQLNTKNKDYIVKVAKSKDPKDDQDPSEYQEHYQLSVTVINEEKTISDLDLTGLAGIINDLYKEGKVDRLKFTTNEKEGKNLNDVLDNISDDEERKAKISKIIKEDLASTLTSAPNTKLVTIKGRSGYMRLSKKACGDKEAFLWLRIPFSNAIVNEMKDKIQAQDITVNKNADVNWKDGVKLKDEYKSKKGYQGYIDNAAVADESNRNTDTAGEKTGKIKLTFSDDSELTLENQKLIVKEALPQIKDNENNKYDRYDKNNRYDRYNKDKKNESKEKNTKESKNDKVAKETKPEEKAEKTEAKQDHGIQAPAQALRLVQHTDLPQGEKGEATRELLARGVLSGVSDTKFKGKLAINRAMLAQVLMTISKDKSVGFIDYLDIKGDEWYADAMTWALTHGIYKGYTDKTVKAAQNITRQEFASVIYNFIKEHNINMPKIKNFNYKDQDQIASWALNQVKYLDEIGLVSGASTDNYNAKGTYTREELALTIYKIIKFIENK
ncbi:MAG: S-layer homology domain-containing protein [Fenollaria massiliensis]